MRILPPAAGELRFEMTAMMDIVFQLIAFFMIVSTFIVREKVEVELPVAPQAQPGDDHPGRLTVSVTADGTIWLGAQRVELDTLAAAASAWQREQPQGRIVLRSDRASTYATVKQVMKVCREAGLTDLTFASHQSGP